MKLEVHKGEKVSEPDFWGKFPFCPNWEKWPNNGPFDITSEPFDRFLNFFV